MSVQRKVEREQAACFRTSCRALLNEWLKRPFKTEPNLRCRWSLIRRKKTKIKKTHKSPKCFFGSSCHFFLRAACCSSFTTITRQRARLSAQLPPTWQKKEKKKLLPLLRASQPVTNLCHWTWRQRLCIFVAYRSRQTANRGLDGGQKGRLWVLNVLGCLL